jgi:hypothetical protein
MSSGKVSVFNPARRELDKALIRQLATCRTIVTSQLPPTQWHDYVNDPTGAEIGALGAVSGVAPPGRPG